MKYTKPILTITKRTFRGWKGEQSGYVDGETCQ